MEGSRPMLGCPVRYMDVKEDSWAKLECLVKVHGGVHERPGGLQAHAGVPKRVYMLAVIS
jgi:hypothetical protein